MDFNCVPCKMVFAKQAKYLKHQVDFHGRTPTFNCTKCSSYAGPSLKALREHSRVCSVDHTTTQSN